jgi:hypothetical protein
MSYSTSRYPHFNAHMLRYLVVPGFLTGDETATLLARAKQLLDGFDINDHPLVRKLLYKCIDGACDDK